MEQFDKGKGLISYFSGEFKDKSLEREFTDHDIEGALKYIRPVLLIMGILYFLFIIPDYYVIKNSGAFRLILFNRIVFLAFVLVLYFRVKHFKKLSMYYYWVTVYEILVSLLFLMIFSLYESANFLIQSYGVVIIILAVFLVPNRWLYMIFVSVLTGTGFFVLAPYCIKTLNHMEYLAAIVYIALAVILSSISSLRVNFHKRIQFFNSKELLRLSTIDQLTGIYNRFKFDEELDRQIKAAHRYSCFLSIILFDFDDFKRINDNFGHPAGDSVLADTAAFVKDSIRNTDFFARWGGEEFVILLPNTGLEHAIELAGRLKIGISGIEFGIVGHITCSFGVTVFEASDDATSLTQRVDRLLYRAKQTGKNLVVSG